MTRRLFLTLLFGAAALLAAFLWFSQSRSPAPALSLTTLQQQPIQLAQLKGQVVLVNFWATSCSTCMKEMPELVQLQQRWQGKAYTTLSIAMAYDSLPYVQRYVAEHKLPFLVVHDVEGRAAKAFGDIKLTPTSFLIDRQGNIVRQYLGKPDMQELERSIAQLLA